MVKRSRLKFRLLIIISVVFISLLIIQKGTAIAQREVKFELEVPKTALIVIDMQNDFVRKGGAGYVPDAIKTVGNIQALIEFCRGRKIPIFFTKFILGPVKTVYNEYYYGAVAQNMCKRGSKRFYPDVQKELDTPEIIDELRPQPEDIIIEKYGLDSFVDTPLNTFLQVLGMKNVILTGTVTDACVNATAIGAWHHNYHVVVITDAISGVVPERDEWTLKSLPVRYGKLMTTAQVIKELTK